MEITPTRKDQIIANEQESFSRFRRALRKPDQLALNDLFDATQQHAGLAQYAPHALPFEVLLLTMLLEEHKLVLKLRERVEDFLLTQKMDQSESGKVHLSQNTIPGSVDPGIGFDDDPKNG